MTPNQPRFRVDERLCFGFYVWDTLADEEGYPLRAVSIYFRGRDRAERVCALLNQENDNIQESAPMPGIIISQRPNNMGGGGRDI